MMCKTIEALDALNEVATTEGLDLVAYYEAVERKAKLTAMVKSIEKTNKEADEKMIALMKKMGIKKVVTPNGYVITLVEEHDRETADNAKMRSEGVWDYFKKITHVRDALRCGRE